MTARDPASCTVASIGAQAMYDPADIAINVDIGDLTLWAGIVLIILIGIRTTPHVIRAVAELVRAHKESPRPRVDDRQPPRALDAPREKRDTPRL